MCNACVEIICHRIVDGDAANPSFIAAVLLRLWTRCIVCAADDTSRRHWQPLQWMQDAATRLILELGFARSCPRWTDELKWLPINYTLTAPCHPQTAHHCALRLQGLSPNIILSTSHSARRSGDGLCSIVGLVANNASPCLRVKFGTTAFSHALQAAWNSLSAAAANAVIRSICIFFLVNFKRPSKTNTYSALCLT